MGGPTEVSDAPATPTTGGSWDLRSRELVSEGVIEAGPLTAPDAEPASASKATEKAATEKAATEKTAAEQVPAEQTSAEGAATPRAPEIARAAPARKLNASRRGPADPVKSLMHRHRELCERAVDPLEIAAGLEAHGVTDRAAARYRHRDVFSLAEELFARVPAVAAAPATAVRAPERDTETRAAWSLRALVPGAACIATVGSLRLTEGVLGGQGRLAIALTGALVGIVGLALSLRSGPLHAEGRSSGTAHVYGCWLLGYVLYGEALLDQVLSGGPEGPWTLTPAPLLGLALSVAPAAWCAHLFSVHAHRKLIGSRALEEFAAGVRPLLFGAVALHLCVLAVLLYVAHLGYGGGGAFVGAAALGVLLLLAQLLTVHGFPEPAAVGLASACALEALAPALVLAGRLPGLHFLARPVDALVVAAGTGAVPAVACGAAALGLLITATVALSRASAHATPGDETRTTA
ncbi:hypothetical protein P6B95_30295 [Streptomyces atratus]|uniref:hypothetical protein n=1 Tax=Streptomyces atratus TaxID=1893 RepID=UPI002AC34443|nr:hypothetical protein [Streptomyces atratus]WPW31254.1 hypothetical protein P6B95_30295 [Streptomyces atratus]